MRARVMALIAVLLAWMAAPAGAADPASEANKRILQQFLSEMRTAGYVDRDVAKIRAVVERYVDPHYLQHSKKRTPGREGLVRDYAAFVAAWPKGKPVPDSGDLYFVADGDLVAWVSKKPDLNNPGATLDEVMFQMVRLKDGKLVEHWDSL